MEHFDDATDFMAFVAASPSPRHAVAESVRRLEAAGLAPAEPRSGADAGYSVRGGSLLAWRNGGSGSVRAITAHTDSPNLRIKPRPDATTAGISQFGVEVYRNALLNSWLDRDLGLAGHVVVRTGTDIETRLVTIDRPVVRIPQLAIHLDRDINTKGLLLNKQTHMAPMWGLNGDESGQLSLADLLGTELGVAPDAILAHQLMTFDLTPPALGGWNDEFIASPRIDSYHNVWFELHEDLILLAGRTREEEAAAGRA